MCLFCKIISKEIPANIAYEDDDVLAFHDISPCAPVHLLVIPKKHIATLSDINHENSHIVAHIFEVIAKLAKTHEISEKGYRVVANCNEHGGQEVFHLHYHLIGGKQCQWPPV